MFGGGWGGDFESVAEGGVMMVGEGGGSLRDGVG